MIALLTYCEPFKIFLTDSIREFSEENPDVEVSCIGFCATPSMSDGFLSFDTASHSQEHVAKWQQKGPAWFGEDQFGRFCNNPADFAFDVYRVFEFEGFHDPDAEYTPGKTEIFQSLTGECYEWNQDKHGDYGLCYIMWNFLLKDLMKDFEDFGHLKRSPVFRFGATFHDSDIQEFWKC